ncbi:MAG: hypothetical protein HY776_01135 [Actinobacteria bacterium]|nr:hypothetical protein [Actinomycetota bacterium]
MKTEVIKTVTSVLNDNDKELDEEVRELVDECIDSFLSWDLIVFFQSNPEVKDTISDLSKRLGYREGDLDFEIRRLTEKGLLVYDRRNHTYNYNPSASKKRQIDKFILSLNSRDQRLSVLGRLLQKGI